MPSWDLGQDHRHRDFVFNRCVPFWILLNALEVERSVSFLLPWRIEIGDVFLLLISRGCWLKLVDHMNHLRLFRLLKNLNLFYFYFGWLVASWWINSSWVAYLTLSLINSQNFACILTFLLSRSVYFCAYVPLVYTCQLFLILSVYKLLQDVWHILSRSNQFFLVERPGRADTQSVCLAPCLFCGLVLPVRSCSLWFLTKFIIVIEAFIEISWLLGY